MTTFAGYKIYAAILVIAACTRLFSSNAFAYYNLGMFWKAPHSGACPSSKTVLSFTGSDQTITVPAGCQSATVKMWGGGGGGSGISAGYDGKAGGGGGYTTGNFNVTAGTTYNVIVGGGGGLVSGASAYGGGGASNFAVTDDAGGGGGRSALRTSGGTEMFTAGGGGGGGWSYFTGNMTGGAGGGVYGSDCSAQNAACGLLASSSGGGAGGFVSGYGSGGAAGTAYTGGAGAGGDGAGGGGGYYGGGGGTNGYYVYGGGGGGSGFLEGSGVSTYCGGSTVTGSGSTQANSGDSDNSGAGAGGAGATSEYSSVGVTAGVSGRAVITWSASSCTYTAPVVYLGKDTSTQGNWQGVYGLDGYNVIGDALSYPGYVSSVTASGNTLYTWTTSTGDARALQQTVSGRIAAGWYSGASFTVTVNVTGSTMHKVSLYFLDWDASGRNETVVVSDASTSAVYDTEVVSAFSTTPYYLSWNVSTSVVFTITKNAGPNALLNGIFFK